MVIKACQSGLAVITGYAVFAISAALLFRLSHHDPHAPQRLGFVLFAILYGMAFSALGGMLASWLAPANPTAHAGAVSLVIALGAIISLIASPGAGATWSQWAALALMAPCAWLAAWSRTRHTDKPSFARNSRNST